MFLSLLASLTVAGGTLDVTPDEPQRPADVSALRGWLAQHLAQPRFTHAHWGVVIQSLDTGAELFATNEAKLFVPASSTKLFTGALALDLLGADFRIRTSCHAAAPPDRRGRLRGDLIIHGRGDPTMAARFHGGDIGRALAPLAEAIVRVGVKRVDGALIADDTYFRGPALGSGWDWDDLEFAYGAPVSALSVNENALSLIARPAPVAGQPALLTLEPPCSFFIVHNRVLTTPEGGRSALALRRALGSPSVLAEGAVSLGRTSITETVSVPWPARWFGELLAGELKRRGVSIRKGVLETACPWSQAAPGDPFPPIEVAAVESPPLAELLPLMMKPSQNLHAQLLLLQCGVAWEQKAPAGVAFATTERAGLAALTNFLARIGVNQREVLFEEGTGLSRRNLVTPRAVVALLRHMDTHAAAEVFRDSLPVAGRDGTLRTRMRGSAAADNARAKTGYLAFTYALSGYVTTRAGERLVFALLLNNYQTPDPDRPARLELDDIVVALAGLEARSDASPVFSGSRAAPVAGPGAEWY